MLVWRVYYIHPRHPVIPPEVCCLDGMFLGVQLRSGEVFGCLGHFFLVGGAMT